jgi:hypothetical protein
MEIIQLLWSSCCPLVNTPQVHCQRKYSAISVQLTSCPNFLLSITPRRGPHRKHPVSIVVVQLLQLPNNGLHNTVFNSSSIVVEACLSRCCIATAFVSLFVSMSLPGNGYIRHNTETLRSAHTVYLCVPYGSHSKQPLFP